MYFLLTESKEPISLPLRPSKPI